MKKQKTVQQIYQKKTPLQHILLRPDTYIGTIEPIKQQKWILPKGQMRLQYKQISYTPGFYKIFDQVLVNAADNYQRDKKMNLLKVQINQEQGFISVYNNGKGIPIVVHKQHKIYVPQLIFGHLLTGSNYNDDERRVVGGRNGYGAKLANVFSDKFIVQCGDSENKKKFKMTWKKNMTVHDDAQISSYSGKDYVSVTFYPAFKLFNMERLDDDTLCLLTKRVHDMAGIIPKVKVSLNQQQIDIHSFSQYVDLYFDKQASPVKIFDVNVNNQRWEVIISLSEGEFRQVSFVNGVCTTKGGTHVNYITDQLVDQVQQRIKKKQKNLVIKPFQIKAHIWVFVNCLVQNPTFDTQTKQTLTLKAAQFGSKCQLSDKMIKEYLKLNVVETIISLANNKQLKKLAKATGGQKKSKLTGIPKLEDANEAGTRNSQRCTLILTEGDSAKTLAMSGLGVIGRDYYGVFPLKGKLLNVRDANTKQLGANQQIQNLLKIVGLNIGKQYEDLKQLRYGSIMIMSDQDTDGSHIKGLVINFIHHFWPSLFKIQGFVKQFITPLLKVIKGSQSISFYTMNDFKNWVQNIQNLKSWRIKYYKGLGTSTDQQAKQYFKDLRKHKIDFCYINNQDDQSIDLIFNKKKAQDRKNWLANYDPQTTMVYDRPKIRYKQFVDRQFIHFSNQDNYRSIASLIDGFKPGQRKIIFGCFKRKLEKQIKVAQLAGYIAENSAYHHGQMSLVETIVGMAQNFVGSNNINLLMPNGQFGSRNLGGKDHASARYIFTNLNKVARCIFPQPDDHTYDYVQDDGQVVQPQFYVPIIPMILVNGCQGIGTGWSTFIPNHNPRQIAQIIKDKLRNNKDFPDIHPWYKNFTGQIVPNSDASSYQISGRLYVDQNKDNTVIINQLQVGKWTKDFKLNLDDIMNLGQNQIVGLRQYHTKDSVHFQIEMNQNFFNQMYRGDDDYTKLEKYFKISNSMSTRNLVGFSEEGKIIKMNNAKSILQKFFAIRLAYYQKRKQYLKSRLIRELALFQEKQRFIIEVVEQKISIRNVKRVKLCQLLKQRKFKKFSELPKIKTTKIDEKPKKQNLEGPEGQHDNQNEQNSQQQDNAERMGNNNARRDEIPAKEYNYLLQMPLWNLTYQKVQQIKQKRKQKKEQLNILEKTPIQDMWVNDLDELLNILNKVEQKQMQKRKKQDDQIKKKFGKGKVQKAKKKAPPKQKKQIDWDTEQSDQTKNSIFGNKPKPSKKLATQSSSNISQNNKKIAKKQGKKQQKIEQKQKQKSKKSSVPEDDFLARIHKRMNQAPDSYLTTKPVSKQSTLQQMLSKNKKQKQYTYDIVPNPNKKKQQKKSTKKKMNLDSDEQDNDQYSQYDEDSAGDKDDDDADFLNY